MRNAVYGQLMLPAVPAETVCLQYRLLQSLRVNIAIFSVPLSQPGEYPGCWTSVIQSYRPSRCSQSGGF